MRVADESAKRAITRRVNFTLPVLKAAICPPGRGRIYYYDTKAPGLALLVTEAGAKSFYLVRRIAGQRRNRMRLGGFPDITPEQARNLAEQKRGEIAKGVNVFAEKDALRQDATLGDIWERYRDEHLKTRRRSSTLVTDESRWKTCLADWSTRRANSIGADDVMRKLNDLGKARGHTTANRAMQLLRRMLAFAKVKTNPFGKGEIKFFDESPRERYLTGDELAKLLTAIDQEPSQTIADFCRLCVWTGQRRGNVASMRWEEVDTERAVWAIPPSKFKTGRPLSVPLVKPALEVLASRANNNSEYVFPGRGKTGHLQEPKIAWRHILARAGLTNLHLHDLRHNLASFAVASGASLYAVGKVLGHADSASTARYSHLAMDPIRATITTATDAMTAAVEAAKAKAAAAKTQAGVGDGAEAK
jgi:integrase